MSFSVGESAFATVNDVTTPASDTTGVADTVKNGGLLYYCFYSCRRPESNNSRAHHTDFDRLSRRFFLGTDEPFVLKLE